MQKGLYVCIGILHIMLFIYYTYIYSCPYIPVSSKINSRDSTDSGLFYQWHMWLKKPPGHSQTLEHSSAYLTGLRILWSSIQRVNSNVERYLCVYMNTSYNAISNYIVPLLYIYIYMSICSNLSQNLAPETPQNQVILINGPCASTSSTDSRTFFRFEDSLELNSEGELK